MNKTAKQKRAYCEKTTSGEHIWRTIEVTQDFGVPLDIAYLEQCRACGLIDDAVDGE